MQIDPEIEEATRRLLGHAVRGELDKLAGLLEQSLEIVAPLPEVVVPALLLLARRNRAAKASATQAQAPGAKPWTEPDRR